MPSQKKILMFASCERSFNEQKNVYRSLASKDCKVIFLYTQEKTTQFLSQNTIGNFSFDCNFDVDQNDFVYRFKSISTLLPFIPDVVIISRESWQPETSVIDEFKHYGSIICCIENSSWLYNTIKNRLEILSRFRYPTNAIDVFFDHSSWCYESKKLAGWISNKSVIVGTPKFDDLKRHFEQTETKNVVVFGSMEKNIRPNIMEILSELVSDDRINTKYKICYRPHPKEFEIFSDSFDMFPISNTTVIKKEEDLPHYIFNSVCNIGRFSSVMMYPLLFGKNILYIDDSQSGILDDFDFETFKGSEYEFWKGIINVDSFDSFKSKVGEERVQSFIERYHTLIDNFKSSTNQYSLERVLSSDTDIQNNEMVVKYFDEYNDGNASERISDYILSLFE